MKFEETLKEATLIRRYKRFLADVRFADGSEDTAHCANSGSMKGCATPESRVWLSPNTNPKAKLNWRWELVEIDGTMIGINTSRPNAIVEEAIQNGLVPELAGYDILKREVKYGQNSRIDILLMNEGDERFCYVEVKNVTLRDEKGRAAFPDAVTTRGQKHLQELMDMVREGHRAVMFYLINRTDCDTFTTANDIDPDYGAALIKAQKAGVEILPYRCQISPDGIRVHKPIKTDLD